VHRRVVGLSPREFRAYLIIGALPLPIIDTANRFTLSWVKCERSHGYIEARTILRIRRSRTTRITCIAGRAWVTNQGDLRDFILERGESVDATRGLTIITALEPTVIDIEETSAVSRLKGLLRMPIAAWIEQRIASGKRTSGSFRRTSPVPYY